MAVTQILMALAAVLAIVVYWCKHNFSYWKRKNIPYIKPTPFIGNTKCVFTMKKNFTLYIADMHNDPSMSSAPVVGIYCLHQPALLIREPELIKTVLIKEFNRFSNRYAASNPHRDPLVANNLFFVKSPFWKEIRQKLSPVFTTGKIKAMYPLIVEIGKELEDHLSRYEKHDNSFVTDVKEFCGQFSTDTIASIAFGVRVNSLIDPENEFRTLGKSLFDFTIERCFTFFVSFFTPKLMKWLPLRICPEKFTRTMTRNFTNVINERERSGNKRNDLIDVLVDMKKQAQQDGSHFANKIEFLLAQANVFYIAGFESSSSTMSFALYELAKKPGLQKRLRNEINEALVAENGSLSYETISNLEYLGMVLDETLRMYPILPILDREYKGRTGEPDLTLKPYHNYTIPEGMPVFISVYAIHHDPNIWPNPEEFDPERFTKEKKKDIDGMSYLPFGNGPRNCIGSRIGLLQVKVGLVHILKNHYVELCDNKVKEFDPKAFLLAFTGKLNMKLVNDNMYNNSVK